MCANVSYSVLGAKHNACYVDRQRFLLELWMIAWSVSIDDENILENVPTHLHSFFHGIS